MFLETTAHTVETAARAAAKDFDGITLEKEPYGEFSITLENENMLIHAGFDYDENADDLIVTHLTYSVYDLDSQPHPTAEMYTNSVPVDSWEQAVSELKFEISRLTK